jgi:hypothetical protein
VARLTYDSPVRGIATSGRGGRSFSLGIADSATVLAATAAAADAAATLVANAVNVEHPAIERQPARALDPDSDLLDLPVTVAVGVLPPALVEEALNRGAVEARRLRLCGLIEGAALSLQGHWRIDATAGLSSTAPLRRLDRGPQARAERPCLHDRPLIVEARSLRSALRAPVETTEVTMCDRPGVDRSA